ncbi:MAG: glycosyltransferase family protein [Lachnospiraceae bacterium]|nr:glycosyltransferase family protein [Lachnospiraceae bacterium]
MKVNAIVQARCGSTRLPEKVFALIDGKPLIWHVVMRLKQAKKVDEIIIATTDNARDDVIETWCRENNVLCFRGNEDDVLNRYYEASRHFPSDVVVRITADDPFKEPKVIDEVIDTLLDGDYDLVTNNFPPSFPEGLDCEAFYFKVLEEMEKKSEDSFEREHVTQYVYRNPDKYKIGNVACEKQLSHYRWTIDNIEDLQMVNAIYEKRHGQGTLLMEEILDIIEKNPEISDINATVKRSDMYK